MLKRTITILWALPLLVFTIWFEQRWLTFTLLLAVWGGASVLEVYRMEEKCLTLPVKPMTIVGFSSTLLFIFSPLFPQEIGIPLLLTIIVLASLTGLLFQRKIGGAFARWSWTMAGVLYIGLLLSRLVALGRLADGRDWLYFMFGIVIATDVFAYLTGHYLGKHQMAPVISPNKTWEGAFGGTLGGIIIGVAVAYIIRLPISIFTTILLALLVSIVGQLGDLVKSLLKRNAGVKDSGHILPGHGGALDRLDSVVFAGAVIYYYVIWLIH